MALKRRLILHSLDGLQTQNVEALGQNEGRDLAQDDPTGVDLDDLTGLAVLLDAVADIVELGEGARNLVHVLGQRVEVEVVGDLEDHLGKAQEELGQLHLLLVVDAHALHLALLLQLLDVEPNRPPDRLDPAKRML